MDFPQPRTSPNPSKGGEWRGVTYRLLAKSLPFGEIYRGQKGENQNFK